MSRTHEGGGGQRYLLRGVTENMEGEEGLYLYRYVTAKTTFWLHLFARIEENIYPLSRIFLPASDTCSGTPVEGGIPQDKTRRDTCI